MNKKRKLHTELKNFIINVSWTQRIHVVRADEYAAFSSAFKIVRIILAALTSCGLITMLVVNDIYVITLITAIFSFATTAMIAFDKSVDYDKLSKKEHADANRFLELNEEAQSLLYDVVYKTKELSEIETKFKELKQIRKICNNEVNSDIPNKTINKTIKKLKAEKDKVTEVDEDTFISSELSELKKETEK